MRPLAAPLAALALAAAALAPGVVAATQSVLDRIAEAEDIPVEEWRAMAAGRTLAYEIGGEHWALEYYVPGTDRVILQFHDGTCLNGTWDYEAPLYCFHWEGEGTSCFRHARHGDEILIIETFGGLDTGAIQIMTGVSDRTFACGPAVTS